MSTNQKQQKTNINTDKYKNSLKQIITEIKSDDEKNDEQIIRFFQSDFIDQYQYSDSETSNLETISINTVSERSESYQSFSNNNSIETASDVSSQCEDAKKCARLIKFLLSHCFCIDDDDE